jgi:N-formylglutamate deformylase
MLPIILHVPHSSIVIPSAIRDSFLLSPAELQLELLRMTDAYTDELFECGRSGEVTVRYPVSRLVVDPERFERDQEEPMSRIGMGVIYERTSGGQVLRRTPSNEDREALLAAYYRPHHEALTRAANSALAQHGTCLIVDCHSFPNEPLPYELDCNSERPDICIGTDDYHTPSDMRDSLVAAFIARGYRVALNRPFAGALVPSYFYRRDKNVESVMVELNRALYMDERTGARSNHFAQVQENVAQIIKWLGKEWSAERGKNGAP